MTRGCQTGGHIKGVLLYGLVNLAIREMIQSRFGEDTWKDVCSEAGLERGTFEAMTSYPDSITYDLVGASSTVLKTEPEQLLQDFGEYWVLFSGKTVHGPLMSTQGKTFVEFVQQLDAMHSRIAMTFTDLSPPSFRCSNISENALTLHYYSHREGLAPFVIGLMRGVGKMFGLTLTTTPTVSKGPTCDHVQFHVTFQPAP